MNFSNLTQRIRLFLQYGKNPRPLRDWFIILGVAAVLLGASIGLNTLTFIRLTHGETLGQASAEVQTTSRASVETLSTLLKQRALEEQRYHSEYHYVDPSH